MLPPLSLAWRTACSPTSGSRARSSPTSTTRRASTAGRRRRRSRDRHQGAAARGLRRQAVGLLGAAPRPRPVPRPHPGGAVRGRAGAVGGSDPGRRAADPRRVCCGSRGGSLGTVSLEQAVRGRVVMVTGASSGIGRSAALKIADAGGIVLLVARTAEKLEETQAQIDNGGGTAHVHACDLSDMDDIDRMADEVLARARPRGHPDQQRGPLDPALDRPLLRPHPRLRAHHAAQLLRGGEADPQAPAGDARAALRPDREHQLDRRADQHAAVLGLRRLEGGARRVLALRRLGDRRRGGGDHHDPHAARANADDQADEDVRPLSRRSPRRRRPT